MKKILVLLLNDFTYDARVRKEALSLSKRYEVVIEAFGNEKTVSIEKINDNLQVFRTVKYVRPKNKFIKKLNQLYVYFSYLIHILAHYSSRVDIIHCNDLKPLPVAVILKLFSRMRPKVVYDAHEYETETGEFGFIGKKIVEIIERYSIKFCNAVITVSDSIGNEYVRKYNIQKLFIVMNCPLYNVTKKNDIIRNKLNIGKKKKIFLFIGGLSLADRGIDKIIEAFKKIENSNCVIVFIGSGTAENLIKDTANKYKNIFYHDAIKPKNVLQYTSSADFGFILYWRNCLNHEYALPNKLFNNIMCEIPSIVSDRHEMKRIIEGNNVGVVIRENSEEGILAAIRKTDDADLVKMKRKLRELSKVYNWEVQEKVLLKAYDSIA